MKSMISVIIPVKNDRRLKSTLLGLVDQRISEKYEIIVVDASKGKLDDIRDQFKNKVRWHNFINTTTKRRTTVLQINKGVELSKGEIIAYIDSDCVPTNDWLDNLVSPILREKENFTAGLIKSISNNNYMDKIWSEQTKYKYIPSCPNMNTSIRRSLVEILGPYDHLYNYGWDLDFAWRATEYGYKIRYVPQAVIYHDWGTPKMDLKRNFYYGEAKVRLYSQHINKLKNILNEDPLFVVYPILIIIIPIGLVFPWIFLVIPLLLLNNLKKGNSILIVASHFSYGLGVIQGILRYIYNFLFSRSTKVEYD